MVSAILLLAALVLAPMIGGGFGELTNALLQILIFLAIIARVLSCRVNSRPFARVPGAIPLVVFFVAVLVSVVFSTSIYSSVKQLLFVAACMGAYLLAADSARDARVATALVWGVVLSALGICAMEIRSYAYTTGGGASFWNSLMSSGDRWRSFGPFANPNFFAGFLVMAMPLTLGACLVTRRSLLAVVAGMAFVVEAVALMLTGAKFGIVAGAVALLGFFALAVGTKALRRSRYSRLIIVAVILIPLLIVFSGSVLSRIGAAEEGGSQVHSTQFRMYTWRATIEMIRHNPLFGVGLGAFDTAFPRYEIAGFTQHAHESYLQIAAESGTTALGAFVLALLCIAGGSLAGMLRGGSADLPAKASEEPSEVGGAITWRDLVPFSAWRLMNCAVFASLVGSGVRNLVDSDWYVMGIALPFWILAGLLAARSGAVKESPGIGKGSRFGLVAVCGVLVLASVSLGLGDLLAPDEFAQAGSNGELMRKYELASAFSPLNPKYHRELAKRLAFTQNDSAGALSEIDRALRLDPNDAVNYYIKGVIAAQSADLSSAEESLRKASNLSPHSTQTLYALATVYRSQGDMRRSESTLMRLLALEDTLFEQVKGVPEMVDVTYAYAHAYFGGKYLQERKYLLAGDEFSDAAMRLERWRSNKQMLEVKRAAGMLSADEERQNLELLRDSYFGMADAYARSGNKAKAEKARRNGEKVVIPS